jgi:hypothetical protein
MVRLAFSECIVSNGSAQLKGVPLNLGPMKCQPFYSIETGNIEVKGFFLPDYQE